MVGAFQWSRDYFESQLFVLDINVTQRTCRFNSWPHASMITGTLIQFSCVHFAFVTFLLFTFLLKYFSLT